MAYIIGIDPGTKTGIAVWNSTKRKFELIQTCPIVKAMAILYDTDGIRKVRIEDARKRKWFGARSDAKLQGAGSIKRDCAIWQEFCEYYGLHYEMVDPKHINTKTKPAYFSKLTGWHGRTSEHARDAAMMVFGL
jgi:hypothetical protein